MALLRQIQVSTEEASVLDYIKERMPLQTSYHSLLSLVSSIEQPLGEGAKAVVESWMKQLYVTELADRYGSSLPALMAQLRETALSYAEQVHGNYLGHPHTEQCAQQLKTELCDAVTKPVRGKLHELGQRAYAEVAANEFNLEDREILEVVAHTKQLEMLKSKAGLEDDFQESYAMMARYGILRAGVVLEDDVEFRSHPDLQKSAYDSIAFTKIALREIKAAETYDNLVENLSHLQHRLEDLLHIDRKKVQEYTKEAKPEEENLFQAQYRKEREHLKDVNEEGMKRIYAQGSNPAPSDRYHLIVSLFKEALLTEALGDMDRTRELFDDINGEFEDCIDVLDDPTILLRHYHDFKKFASALSISMEKDYSGRMQEKIDAYKTRKKAEKEQKGWLTKNLDSIVNGDDNYTGPYFVEGETLDGVMVAYQARFAQEKVKLSIVLADRDISGRVNDEQIRKAFMWGLILAGSDKKDLERYGMKANETYSQEVVFTEEEFAQRYQELQERIHEMKTKLAGRDRRQQKYAAFVQELQDLEHAKHTLEAGAYALDEEQVPDYESRLAGRADRLVQIRGTLTEKDIMNEKQGLMRDTFIQEITRSLGGKGIIPALDQQIQAEGGTHYHVEAAWEKVKKAVPEFAEVERIGIVRLVEAVEQKALEGLGPLALAAAADAYLESRQERNTEQKVQDVVTQSVGLLKRLRMKISL